MDAVRERRSAGARAGAGLALLLGGAALFLAWESVGGYGWRRLEVHGDGSEFLLAATLVAVGFAAAGAGLVAALVALQPVRVLAVVVLQLTLLYVVACGGAQLERCMEREGANPPMRWWPFAGADRGPR